MRRLKYILLLLCSLSLLSCDDEVKNSVEETEESTDGYEDGTYAADVTYYNPRTGTRKTYQLNVDVVNNEVTVIHFPNGGWLDDSHINPEQLDANGFCSFTSDKNNQYDIQITGGESSSTDENSMQSDLEDNSEEQSQE